MDAEALYLTKGTSIQGRSDTNSKHGNLYKLFSTIIFLFYCITKKSDETINANKMGLNDVMNNGKRKSEVKTDGTTTFYLTLLSMG